MFKTRTKWVLNSFFIDVKIEFNELIEKLKKENSILKNGNSSNKHIEQIEKENASLKQQLSKLRLKGIINLSLLTFI